MKNLAVSAAALVFGLVFGLTGVTAAYGATEPTPPGDAQGNPGSALGHVELESLDGGVPVLGDPVPVVTPAAPSQVESSTEQNLGSQLSAPAGPEVVGQAPVPVQARQGTVAQAPQAAASGGAVSKIDPHAQRSFIAAPIDSVPGAVSFILVMLLCVGAGLGAAVVISLVTGKKINLGLSR